MFPPCEKKRRYLVAKSNVTIVSDVKDHSPIYIFFQKQVKRYFGGSEPEKLHYHDQLDS